MDVVYSVGPDDGTDFFNLRMSLRSLSKYATGIGRVIIAGYSPKWLSDAAIVVSVKKNADLPKHANILNSILTVIDSGIVKGEFLYSSDDHFLTRRVNLNKYPYYYKKDRLPSFDEVISRYGIRQWKGYYRSLADTRSLLERFGYGTCMFCGHVNTHMDTRDADEVRRLISSRPQGLDGYEPTCLFMNIRQHRDPVKPTFREDNKISEFDGLDSLLTLMENNETISVSEELDENIEFRQAISSIFDHPSKYEA